MNEVRFRLSHVLPKFRGGAIILHFRIPVWNGIEVDPDLVRSVSSIMIAF